jgi:hypothetical protein
MSSKRLRGSESKRGGARFLLRHDFKKIDVVVNGRDMDPKFIHDA